MPKFMRKSTNGQLGFLEVQNSGTLFDDTDGPILVSLLPPKPLLNGWAGVRELLLCKVKLLPDNLPRWTAC